MVNGSKNNEELIKEIRKIVARIIKVPEEKITPEANLFTDLGVDSLLGVEILAALDKKFGLEMPENRLKSVTTISDMVNLVNDLIK